MRQAAASSLSSRHLPRWVLLATAGVVVALAVLLFAVTPLQ